MKENSPRTEETLPSRECTYCPKEACLEFTLVDYWGNPVSSPTQFTLDGMPVSPDTPIMNLKPGSRILKAVDGEDRRKEIALRPYAPQKHWPTPATRKAKNEKKRHREVEGDALWKEGVSLLALPSEQTTESAQCYKYLIEISGGIDYYILMVFLDNHSGGFHGTGHAGTFIIDGKSRKGTYTDFGPYKEVTKEIFVPMMYGEREKITQINMLGEARIRPQNSIVLKVEHGELYEEALADVFSHINYVYGSNIISKEPCLLGAFGKGPAHENFRFKATKAGFYINGIVAWAAYALPEGAYKRMLEYATGTEQKMAILRKRLENGYSMSFNCMTYALGVLNAGKGCEEAPGKINAIDHPNADFDRYMRDAHVSGYFDDRIFQGAPEAVSGREQTSKKNTIKHRESVVWGRVEDAKYDENDNNYF